MLVIRYNRVGRRNHAQFRVVVQEHTVAPGHRHVAIVGSYDPHTKTAQLKADEIKDWISKGAQPSDSVWNLLVREGVVEGEKRKVRMSKKKKAEGEEESDGDEKASEEKSDDVAEEKADEAPEKKEEVKEEKAEEAPEEKKEELVQDKEEKPEEKKEESTDKEEDKKAE